jgi:hypothetical protein
MSCPMSAITHAAAPMARIAPHDIPTQAGVPAPIQANPAHTAPDWQARAISAYHHARCQALMVLPELLAARVSALIGRSINPADVFVDLDAELAIVVVDGVVFRAHNQQVVILRSCAECGITRFESAPLSSRTDLGYALSAWQPHCRACQPEDPADIE